MYSDFAIQSLNTLLDLQQSYQLQSVPHALPWWWLVLTTDDTMTSEVTDGQNDCGIDCYVEDGANFNVVQCKCPEQAALRTSAVPHSYNDQVITETLTAIKFMEDPSLDVPANPRVKDLRDRYQRAMRTPGVTPTLTVTIVVLGELTAPAKARFDHEQQAHAVSGITLELVTWADIRDTVQPPIGTAVDSLIFDFADEKSQVLEGADFVYALVRGIDLVDAFRTHGRSLFDLNVREHLSRSGINTRIRQSLQDGWSRENFHHLNNGLLVLVDDFECIPDGNGGARLSLVRPQVVNGCQTVSSLAKGYRELPTSDQQAFEDAVQVQAKFLKMSDARLISSVVVTTNDQNKMRARNLRANSEEQLRIQSALSNARPAAWFYQRKDGEFEAVRANSIQQLEPCRIPGRSGRAASNFRMLDNEDIARAWYSVLGQSHRLAMGTIKLFEHDSPETGQKAYADIFLNRPNSSFWNDFARPAFVLTPSHLDPGTPGFMQLLMATCLDGFVAYSKATPSAVQQQAIDRLEASLGRSASQQEIANGLATDLQYKFDVLFYNSSPVVLECMALVLLAKYGPLDGARCADLLETQEAAAFATAGFKDYPDPTTCAASDTEFLWRVYEYTKLAYFQFYFSAPQVQAGSRGGRSEMAKRTNVQQLRSRVIGMLNDPAFAQVHMPWKPMGRTLIETLPS